MRVGVHRVQRIPTTETSGRIHTSAVTVAVLPEAEEIDVQIDEATELRIDTYRSSGPGGQSGKYHRFGYPYHTHSNRYCCNPTR